MFTITSYIALTLLLIIVLFIFARYLLLRHLMILAEQLILAESFTYTPDPYGDNEGFFQFIHNKKKKTLFIDDYNWNKELKHNLLEMASAYLQEDISKMTEKLKENTNKFKKSTESI